MVSSSAPSSAGGGVDPPGWVGARKDTREVGLQEHQKGAHLADGATLAR